MNMRRSIAPLLLLGVAGCTAVPADYPSLLPRPIESAPLGEPAAPPPPPLGDVSAAIAAALQPIIAAGDAADTTFRSELAAVTPEVARASGAAPGSETWIAGQEALSRATAARGAISAVLADLDSLERANPEAGEADRAAIAAAIARLSAIDAAQGEALAALSARLR